MTCDDVVDAESRSDAVREAPGTVIRRLADGRVLREATARDAERMAAFQGAQHSDTSPDEPDLEVGAWARDLLALPHPTVETGDFLIIDDPRSGHISSALCVIPQRWSYEGVPFTVGRLELIATAPEDRRQGLVRALMIEAHDRGAARGHLAQVITGIPGFYRQFGYEMAIELEAARGGAPANVPPLAAGSSEIFLFRNARSDDIPFLRRLYDDSAHRHALHCLRDDREWEYELGGRSDDSVMRQVVEIVERRSDGLPVGFIARPPRLYGAWSSIGRAEVAEKAMWPDVGPAVVRHVANTGRAQSRAAGAEWAGFRLRLGADHPCYGVLADALPLRPRPYAWYVRIAQVPEFVAHIGPALEARLAASELAGWSGALSLSFFRSGVRIEFDAGRLAGCTPWRPDAASRGDASFPELTFLQLLTGFRSLQDLMGAYPDCLPGPAATRRLVEILFPKKQSAVWPIA